MPMMAPFPAALYRGDKDPDRLRKVFENWNKGWLQTNLGSGGRGTDIFSTPLTTLVEQHANSTWSKTHFLSFSTHRQIAEWFARGETPRGLTVLPDDAATWDTSVFQLDLARM